MNEVFCLVFNGHSGRVKSEEVGVINAEGPPVPIPNTEVKLCRAEDTQLATARENRYAPTQSGKPHKVSRSAFILDKAQKATKKVQIQANAPLAQLVEQLTLNQWVRGSSPRRCMKRLEDT